MNSPSQQQSTLPSAFKNTLTLLHNASRLSTNLLMVTAIHSFTQPSIHPKERNPLYVVNSSWMNGHTAIELVSNPLWPIEYQLHFLMDDCSRCY